MEVEGRKKTYPTTASRSMWTQQSQTSTSIFFLFLSFLLFNLSGCKKEEHCDYSKNFSFFLGCTVKIALAILVTVFKFSMLCYRSRQTRASGFKAFRDFPLRLQFLALLL